MSLIALDLPKRFYERRETYTLENTIEINRPIQEVFDAVTTTKLWELCYPETLSVGGVTKRPFKKGDLILERFMFAGEIFSVFQYEVDEYDPPYHITFHGIQLMTQSLLEVALGGLLDHICGTFDYDLESLGENKTRWVRKLHLYHTGGLAAKAAYKMYMARVLRSQKKGAQIFVENTKHFLEQDDYKVELYR